MAGSYSLLNQDFFGKTSFSVNLLCHKNLTLIFNKLPSKKLDKEKTKQRVIDGILEVDEKPGSDGTKKKGKKAKDPSKVQEVKKSGRPVSNRRAKYPQIYGTKTEIPKPKRVSDNSGVLTMANFLSKADDVSTHDGSETETNKPTKPEQETMKSTEPEQKSEEKSLVPPRESKSPGLVTVLSAKKKAMAWKTKVNDRFDPETQDCFHVLISNNSSTSTGMTQTHKFWLIEESDFTTSENGKDL